MQKRKHPPVRINPKLHAMLVTNVTDNERSTLIDLIMLLKEKRKPITITSAATNLVMKPMLLLELVERADRNDGHKLFTINLNQVWINGVHCPMYNPSDIYHTLQREFNNLNTIEPEV